MKSERRPLFFMLFFSALLVLLILIMQPLQIIRLREYIAVLFPDGLIGLKERDLLLIIQALMLLVIIPVYILTFIFSWKYSANNPKGKYDPDLVDNKLAEYIWWGFPIIMTLIVATLTWIKTEELDPFKPIPSEKKEKTIQVVALQWKWLFIYPEEKIATVNFVQIPKDVPIHFVITADAPMNSFWIPELGGQIYAMPRMRTELYLIADKVAEFRGLSANLSGEGFAGMHFLTKATEEEDFQKWIESVKKSTKNLDLKAYEALALPSKNNSVETYLLQESNLFSHIINKYMHPKGN